MNFLLVLRERMMDKVVVSDDRRLVQSGTRRTRRSFSRTREICPEL
jgi:hypothetical protein